MGKKPKKRKPQVNTNLSFDEAMKVIAQANKLDVDSEMKKEPKEPKAKPTKKIE